MNNGKIKYLDPVTLRGWFNVRNLASKKDFIIIDVRDSDFVGGKIKDSINYPSIEFESKVTKLQDYLFLEKVNDVVFHCMLSQIRGPTSATIFYNSLKKKNENPEKQKYLNDIKPHIWVLKGGFKKWKRLYGSDTEVTHDYNLNLLET